MKRMEVMGVAWRVLVCATVLTGCRIARVEGLESHEERVTWLAERCDAFGRLGGVGECATRVQWLQESGSFSICVESFVWIGKDEFLLYGALAAPESAMPAPGPGDLRGEYILFSLATSKREVDPKMGDVVRYQGWVLTETGYGRAVEDLAEGRNPMLWLPEVFGQEVEWSLPVEHDEFREMRERAPER